MPPKLQTYFRNSSEKGLSSVTILAVGVQEAVLFDPPFLLPDSHGTVAWIKNILQNQKLKAIFVTHHHPDHFFAASVILDSFPDVKFYAAPYVVTAIKNEYHQKTGYWQSVFGPENIASCPRIPDPYHYSICILAGNPESPIHLIGPVQGDSVDHTLFWMPREHTLICGDTVYARSTHVWVEEIESPALLEAWRITLKLIEGLRPQTLIPGHIEMGWSVDAAADLAHTARYLDLFAEKIMYAPQKAGVSELYKMFEQNFPEATKNLDFFLGHLSNHFGEGGKIWEENRHQCLDERSSDQVQGFWIE